MKAYLRLSAGQEFGRLTVADPETRKTDRRAALCDCSCGTTSILVFISHLTSGAVRSCGCIRREQVAERNHSNAKHDGATKHPLWSTWHGMIQRCENADACNYYWYGERGVKVCPEWHDPNIFIKYIEENLGPRSKGMTLDRIDNDGNYEPGNVKWSDPLEQAGNRRKRDLRG